MRADRLVAVLLLLQARGQVTAAEVAAELEVSQRTARRDLDALGMAGIPIYSVQGRGGGWRLAGGGRTDLSGLTADEARALFLLAGPSASATPEVRAALRKLVRALPEPLRQRAEVAARSVVVDPSGWGVPDRRGELPHLEAVQRAVVDQEQLRLGYTTRSGRTSTRVVHPLGLGAKGSTWYLLTDTDAGLRAFRVDRITAAEPTGEPAVRPEGFDLREAWSRFVDKVEELRTPVRARGLLAPDMASILRWVLGTRVSFGAADEDGRVHVKLRGNDVRALAGEIAGFGAALEILDPPELRTTLAQIGEEMVDLYRTAEPVHHTGQPTPRRSRSTTSR